MASLMFRNNACRIDLKVAGMESRGSGFLYLSSHRCSYDYVITAKHIISETDSLDPVWHNISNLSIKILKDENLVPLDLYSDSLQNNIYFHETWDIAIIRVKKLYLPQAKKVWLKNVNEIQDEIALNVHGYPTISREVAETVHLRYHPDEKYRAESTSQIRDIDNFHGISGSAACFTDRPYVVSIISNYSHRGFELNKISFATIDWDRINQELSGINWAKLDRGESAFSRIGTESLIFDIREISINGVTLDLERALVRLRRDMIDDWFFDPLHYMDLCRREYLLKYFCDVENREKYQSRPMEIYYIPKESLVQRKAMVGNFTDRLIYMAVVSKLAPIMEMYISRRIYGARLNSGKGESIIANGVEQWLKMNYLIDEWLNKGSGCIFKVDILNYYDNISHDTLTGYLKEITTDDEDIKAVEFLGNLLSGFSGGENYGLPQNSDASALLATFYLSHVDAKIQAQSQDYCRFMDDIYFLASDYFKAREILQSLERELRRLNLCLNSAKVKCVKLETTAEVDSFRKSLSLYNHTNQKIKLLLGSESLRRRQNGIALAVSELGKIMQTPKPSDKDKRDKKEDSRRKKFLLYILCNHPLTLSSNWNYFYQNLLQLIDKIKYEPDDTPLVCRLISCISMDRNLDDAKQMMRDMLLRTNGCEIYPWQAYHLWLLMAHLKFDDSLLIKYASSILERNDNTRRIEIAAIIIYLSSVRPSYSRVILEMLGRMELQGYIQIRAALIACRSLNPESVTSKLPLEYLFMSSVPHFLHRNRDKGLVLLGNISSSIFKHSREPLFSDFYSGL